MEAYDHRALDASAKEIVDHAKRTNARVCGPIPIPTRIERYTVLRSPHIDKKSREQFEMRTHKRVIDIFEPTARTVEALESPGRAGRCVCEDQGLIFLIDTCPCFKGHFFLPDRGVHPRTRLPERAACLREFALSSVSHGGFEGADSR